MLLRLRQLTAHVLMLQFVMRDLLEREDIERIREVVNDQAADNTSRKGQTILAISKQLDNLAAYDKKIGAEKAAKRAKRKAVEAKGQEFDDDDDDVPDTQPDMEESGEEDDFTSDLEQHTQGTGGHGRKTGGDFGKNYNFKPFLGSLKTGEHWEKAKEKARCSWCGKQQPKKPYMTSCGHLICGDKCYETTMMLAAEEDKAHSPCKACGITPHYIHPCDPDGDDSPEPVSSGTRSTAAAAAAKKKDRQRKRCENEDLAEDWLASVGEDVLPSAKTIAVKAQILNWIKENPKVKIIIYTQFLAM